MFRTDLQQHEVVRATYQPQRTDDLMPGTAEWIGWRGIWYVAWEVEAGPYKGDWAMMPFERPCPPFAWAPFCDLADVELAALPPLTS